MESRIPTCLAQGSFKGLGVTESGRREGNAVLAVLTNRKNPRIVNVATEAKFQSALGFGKTCHCSRIVRGTSSGGVSFQPGEGRERSCGAARPGMRGAAAQQRDPRSQEPRLSRFPPHLVPAEHSSQRGRGPARPAMGRAGATGRSAPDDAAASDWPPARHSLLTMVAAQSNKPRRPLPP